MLMLQPTTKLYNMMYIYSSIMSTTALYEEGGKREKREGRDNSNMSDLDGDELLDPASAD
jgi:hypothetical protein